MPPTQADEAKPITFAVIGDTPYGAEQLATFPRLVDTINDDRAVGAVLHLGDIKIGSSPCTDDYNRRIYFERFADPLLYTPGDNEWTDCHRTTAGGHDPLQRLAAVRSTFFPAPGEPLGARPLELKTQASARGYRSFVENVRSDAQAQTVLATVHAVGSNNGLDPWFGGAETPAPSSRARPRRSTSAHGRPRNRTAVQLATHHPPGLTSSVLSAIAPQAPAQRQRLQRHALPVDRIEAQATPDSHTRRSSR